VAVREAGKQVQLPPRVSVGLGGALVEGLEGIAVGAGG
jgi:hypothetical protein